MPIQGTDAKSDFSYINGNNPWKDAENRLDSIGLFLSSSVLNYATVNDVINLPPYVGASLPTGLPTGSVAISGSTTAMRLYLYNGTNWMSASFSVI